MGEQITAEMIMIIFVLDPIYTAGYLTPFDSAVRRIFRVCEFNVIRFVGSDDWCIYIFFLLSDLKFYAVNQSPRLRSVDE